MINRISVLIPFFILLGCATSSPIKDKLTKAGKYSKTRLIGKIDVHHFELENGLNVFHIEDFSSPTFSYQTWVRVGSKNEIPGQTGLAHLFEHMMFKETKNLKAGEFDRLMSIHGAVGLNAYTTRDFTVYHQQLPKDHFDFAAKTEADRFSNLIIDENAFRTEVAVVHNEKRFRIDNSPPGQMWNHLYSTSYSKHNYQRPVIGYVKDLDAMTAQNALDFYKKYYTPNRLTIVISGALDIEQVMEGIEKHYGSMPPGPDISEKFAEEPVQYSVKRKTLKLGIEVQQLLMAYHIPDVNHEDMPALSVLGSLLSSGNKNRLRTQLIETGIANVVYADADTHIDPGLFYIGAYLQKGKRASIAERIILKELNTLKSSPIPMDELQQTKNKIEFSFYQQLADNDSRAQFIGSWQSLGGDYQNGVKFFRQMQAVTPQDVQRVAQIYFKNSNRTVITGVPK